MHNLTFGELTQFLTELGFSLQTIPGSHHLFKQNENGPTITLRMYRMQDVVESAGLAYVRHTLDQWDIMDRDTFDEQIKARSLAG